MASSSLSKAISQNPVGRESPGRSHLLARAERAGRATGRLCAYLHDTEGSAAVRRIQVTKIDARRTSDLVESDVSLTYFSPVPYLARIMHEA
jgi:hypothetical protein